MASAVNGTEFDMCGLGCLGGTDTDCVRCSTCDSQGALNQYGKPAYANYHYGIRFDAKSKCPKCKGLGQHKDPEKFIKRILGENKDKDPTKETDFFRRKMWEEFSDMDSDEIDSTLYKAISDERSSK